ncbi:sporulation protein YpjB [Bacillus sp. FSL W7-1360]
MRQWLIGLILLILLMVPMVNAANTAKDHQAWKELNHIANQVLQLTNQEKYEEAKRLMSLFADTFLAHEFQEENWTMSVLRTFTMAYENALHALTAVQLHPDERQRQVMSFRLTVDALSNRGQPLWLHTEKDMLQKLAALAEAIEVEQQTFYHRVNELTSFYEMIRPALKVQLPQEDIGRLDANVTFLSHESFTLEQAPAHIAKMKEDFIKVYEQQSLSQFDPSLIGVIATIGGAVFIALMYAGVKKYRAEKRKVKAKQ